MLQLLCTLVILVAVSAAPSKKDICCAPGEMEGALFVTGSVNKINFLEYGKFSFDAKNMLFAANIKFQTEAYTADIRSIVDYKKSLMYVIREGKCTVVPNTSPYIPPCIPGDAVKVYESYLGANNNRLNFTTYSYTVRASGVEAQVKASVTKECYAVGAMINSNLAGKGKMFLQIGYNGVTFGIKDRHVFDIPAICKHTDEENMHFVEKMHKRNHDFRLH